MLLRPCTHGTTTLSHARSLGFASKQATKGPVMRDARNRIALNPSFGKKSAAVASGNAIANLIKHARSSGALNLSCKDLTEVPAELYTPAGSAPGDDVNWGQNSGQQAAAWWEVAELTKLDLNGNAIRVLPAALFPAVSALTNLNVSSNKLQELPEDLEELQQLRSLTLTSNPLQALPDAAAHLPALANLACNDCQLLSLPEGLGGPQQPSFSALNASHNQLTALPSGLAAATALVKLHLGHNRLLSLPEQLAASWRSLQELDVSFNQLQALPAALGRLPALKILQASNNQLLQLPAALAGASALLELHLGNNRLLEVPEELGMLAQLRLLNLCDNQLTELPTPLCGLSLNLLDLRNNSLRSLPPQLGAMSSLRSVPLDGNPLKLIRREVWSGPVSGLLDFLRSRMPTIDQAPTAATAAAMCSTGRSSLAVPGSGNVPGRHHYQQQQQQDMCGPRAAAGPLPKAAVHSSTSGPQCTYAAQQQQQQQPAPAAGQPVLSAAPSVAGHVRGGELLLRQRGLHQLPHGFEQALEGVTRLDLSCNPLGTFPPALLQQQGAHQQQLRSLNLSNTGLAAWPLPLGPPGQLPALTSLDLSGNKGLQIPAAGALAAVPSLRSLDLSGVAAAGALPPGFFTPVQQLQSLAMVGVPLQQLGQGLVTQLPASLTRLDVSSCGITSVAEEVTRLTRLEELYLTNNSLSSLPPLLGRMGPHLRCLQLDGNCLRTIRRPVLDRGTAAVLEYLATRILT